MGSHVHFYHQPEPGGLRARALNLALEHTHHKAQLIAVIPAGTQVDKQILHDLVPQFQIETGAIVHASQRFRDAEQNLFKAICSTEYRDIFHAGLKTRDRHDMILHHGKISLIRRALLEETGGWDESTIGEDAEIDIRACEQGYEVVYNPAAYASGLTPDTFAAYRQQRFRWSWAALDVLRRHSNTGWQGQWRLLPVLLPWFNDALIVAIALAVLAWSVLMIMMPSLLTAPPFPVAVLFSMPLLLKIALQIHHLRGEVQASIPASAAAVLARLSLLQITAHALMEHLRSKQSILRTPKQAQTVPWQHALKSAHEEIALLTGLILTLTGLCLRGPAPDANLLAWLLLQGALILPYLAALLMALISSLPFLPARLLRSAGG